MSERDGGPNHGSLSVFCLRDFRFCAAVHGEQSGARWNKSLPPCLRISATVILSRMLRVDVLAPGVSPWLARAMASWSDSVGGSSGFRARVTLSPSIESAMTSSRLSPRRRRGVSSTCNPNPRGDQRPINRPISS